MRRAERDPIEQEIEPALNPGSFIRDRACFPFVRSLEEIAARIEALGAARAAALYEIFLAGCREKAEELDDSSGSFGLFAKDLICRWVKARQASGGDPVETVRTVLAWMDADPYAFCFEIEGQLAKALGKAELAAFERLIRVRFDATPEEERYDRSRWGAVLRAIYVAQQHPAAYQAFAEETGLEPKDCLALATMSVSQKPEMALEWVERGLDLERATPHGSAAGYDLNRLRRELLTTLGRNDEAVEAAWIDFQKHPSKYRSSPVEVLPLGGVVPGSRHRRPHFSFPGPAHRPVVQSTEKSQELNTNHQQDQQHIRLHTAWSAALGSVESIAEGSRAGAHAVNFPKLSGAYFGRPMHQ
jgi:hypothetical protein